MIIAGTGHRPDKLQDNWGQYEKLTLPRLTFIAKKYFEIMEPEIVISGTALGWDTAIALAAIELKIPLHCYVPFEGYHKRWAAKSQTTYFYILNSSNCYYPDNEKEDIERDYAEVCRLLQQRNADMLDNCDRVVALWNGTKGGTANAVKLAAKKELPVDNLWECWITLST
jgi:uncharacterized phage-like protein YoqJ